MSMTTGERRALSWLLAVIVVGAGVKVTRYWRHAGDALPSASEALKAQLLAVDSAQEAGKRVRSGRTAGRSGGANAQRRRRSSVNARAADELRNAEKSQPNRESEIGAQRPTLVPVDVDVADSASLERLPRIGPALAARIVADRARHGPFGSLAELERVRGIGPKLAQAVAAHVTFSGTRRPSAVQR